MTTLALALTLLQTAPPLDEGTLVIRVDTVEVARESFRLTTWRRPGGDSGWTLTATVRYDRTRPVVVLSPILQVGRDTLPETLQYDVNDPREPTRILGQYGRGRFTVRFLARATERAREFPASGRTAVLDDSVFALYLFAAWRAPPAPGVAPVTLTVIVPRGARRETIELQNHGLEPTLLNRTPATLRRLTLTGGANQVVHVWLSPDDRLMKVEIPSRQLSAMRLPG